MRGDLQDDKPGISVIIINLGSISACVLTEAGLATCILLLERMHDARREQCAVVQMVTREKRAASRDVPRL